MHRCRFAVIDGNVDYRCINFLFIRWFGFIVLNATFNNISVISWRSVLLVEETRVPGENHPPVASHWQTLSHNVVSNRLRTHNFSGDRQIAQVAVNPTKHTIRTTTAPHFYKRFHKKNSLIVVYKYYYKKFNEI